MKTKLARCDQLTILALLWQTRMFQATSPRDKFFALAGLSSNFPSNLIDYKSTST